MTAPRFGTTLERLTIRENQIFLALTIVIAIISGLSAVLFTLAIQGVQHSLFGMAPSGARLVLVPMLVSICTGFLLARYFPDARGSGVPQTKAAFHLNDGRIPPSVPIGKFVTGALCVGSGHSMGREGPSVQIGAGLAATIGRYFNLSPERARNLVPVGAAAALAAAFNTPVAAVLFSLEEIIGDMNASLIGSTVLASVTAVVVERAILGDETLFRVPAYHLVHPAELIAYALLGIFGGLISLLFCKGLLRLRSFFLKLPPRTVMFQPAVGGLIVGVLLLFVPQVMGVGYQYVDQALNGGMLPRMMLLLCFAKLLGTIVSYASGNAGGIFAPSLYLGAMAGGAMGSVIQTYAPFPTGGPGAYALVGMGTLFAGIIRAPMTSVFMIFELTQDYQILVPLMVANMLSLIVSKRFQPVPVYNALLQQNHIYLPEAEGRSGQGRRVSEIMDTRVELIPELTPISEAHASVVRRKENAILVGAHSRIKKIVTRKTLEHAIKDGHGMESIASLTGNGEFTFLHPDDSLETALERFTPEPGVLPVISRMGRRVEGILTLETILQFVQRQLESGGGKEE